VKGSSAYENQNEIPGLPVDGGDDADGDCRGADGGTARTLQGCVQRTGYRLAGAFCHRLLDTAATGTGTHLGQFSLAQVLTVNLANHTAIGSARWIAGNGDYIDTTVVSAAEPADIPDLLKITEINTITGGTGRFTGAEGSFTVERLHNLVTSATFGSFHGTITSTGAAR